MSAVTLEFDAADEVLVLRGADDGLRRNPLFAAYLRQASGSTDEAGDIRLPTAADALTARYQGLTKIFGRLGVDLETRGHVSDALGFVWIQDSHPSWVVIQAADGPIRFD